MYIILFTGEIPHKIPEIHPIHLITHEELDIVCKIGVSLIGAILCFAYAKVLCIIVCMSLIVACIPYTREQHHFILFIYIAAFFSVFNVVIAGFDVFSSSFFVVCWLSSKLLPPYQRKITILIAAKVTYQTHGVIYIIHVYCRICIAAYHSGDVSTVSNKHKCKTPKAEV